MNAGEPNSGAEVLHDSVQDAEARLLPTESPLEVTKLRDAELAKEFPIPADAEAPQTRNLGEASARRMRRLMAVTDVVALCLAWALTGVIVNSMGQGTNAVLEILVFLGCIPLWLLLGSITGLYHSTDRRIDPSIADEAGKLLMVATAWVWMYLLISNAIVVGSSVMPTALIWLLIAATVILFRPIARHFAHRRDWYAQNVLVIGRPDDVSRVWRRLARHPEYGLRPKSRPGIWETVDQGRGDEELLELVQEQNASRVMIASAFTSGERRGDVIRCLRQAGVQVDIAVSVADSYAPSVILNYLEGIPVMSMPVIQRSGAMRVMKRLLDLAVASFALIVLAPVMFYCAIRIKLDSPGPVFFRQRRRGKNEQPFELLKFRSMNVGADAERESLRLNSGLADGPGIFKLKQDPRVTKFGATLRRWSLDELPQLINVIRGDMSLVGPRPLPVEEVAQIKAGLPEGESLFDMRFKVLPGITGAWQAHGRSDIGFEDMVQLDYMYVSNWSFAEDLKLILRTIEVILHGRGAY